MAEVWRIIMLNPKYEVSNEGRVRNRSAGRIMKPYKPGGCRDLHVSLSSDGVSQKYSIVDLMDRGVSPNTFDSPPVYPRTFQFMEPILEEGVDLDDWKADEFVKPAPRSWDD